jgi:protease-4
VIYAEGAIISGASSSDFFGSQYVGDRTLRKYLKEAREDDSIKSVVLRVNSPGGSGQASDAIWRDVALTQEVKPVIVSMGDYAASGGYYISMGSSRIFAEPGTITGSIGVFGGKMNLAGAYEKVGVSLHTEQRGRYANLFGSTSDFDDLERQKYQEFLASFYRTFVTKAADGRVMSYEDMHEVAQGRVWTGEQALERGLVDELGGLDAAVAYAADEAGMTGDLRLVRMPERRGFLDALLEQLSNPEEASTALLQPGSAALEALPRDVRAGLGALERLERIAGAGGAVLLLPGEPVIH